MNLSPRWTEVLEVNGWEAVHWSEVGNPRAADRVIMDWARANDYVVLTHDLDFGALLALTRAEGPSVIQVRAQNLLPEHMGGVLVAALRQHEKLLGEGALIVVDETRSRSRILPLGE